MSLYTVSEYFKQFLPAKTKNRKHKTNILIQVPVNTYLLTLLIHINHNYLEDLVKINTYFYFLIV